MRVDTIDVTVTPSNFQADVAWSLSAQIADVTEAQLAVRQSEADTTAVAVGSAPEPKPTPVTVTMPPWVAAELPGERKDTTGAGVSADDGGPWFCAEWRTTLKR